MVSTCSEIAMISCQCSNTSLYVIVFELEPLTNVWHDGKLFSILVFATIALSPTRVKMRHSGYNILGSKDNVVLIFLPMINSVRVTPVA